MNTTIIGSGVYGKAMANILLANGNNVTLWTEKEDLTNILVPSGATITNSYEVALKDAKLVYILTGSQFVESVLIGMKPYLTKDMIVILGSKGILEDGTLLTDLFERYYSDIPFAVISGPTFAVDIAALEPIGFTIGTKSYDDYKIIAEAMKSVYLEYSDDVNAIEMAGSLKNAYAIGSGILSGFNYGPSTRCLYITRVLKEIEYIFNAFGLKETSSTTLAGVGDLVLTCTSLNSRNFTFGSILSLNNREEKEEYLKTNTVEGYENLKAYKKLFESKNIDAPILKAVSSIVEGKEDPEELIKLILKK